MTEHENEIFAQITGAEDNADLAEVQAPKVDERKNGIYYLKDETEADGFASWSTSVYQVVTDHRVVAHVRVSENATVDPAAAGIPSLIDGLTEGSTVHAIELSTPNGSVTIPTSGVTVKAPGGIYNRSMIKLFVVPRLAKYLVRLYGIGA